MARPRSVTGPEPRGSGALSWCVAYAAATFFAFPQPIGDRVMDGGIVLAYVAPACLVLALRGLAPGRALRLGFLASLLAHSAVLHWIYVVTVSYGHAPAVLGVVAPVALAGYIAAFGGLFAGAASWLGRGGLPHPLLGACLWTALDHLRAHALTGFPWATLGYALHADEALLGLARATGVYGLSFSAALGGLALARWFDSRRWRPDATVVTGLLGVLVLHLAGAALGRSAPAPSGPTLQFAALQGNVDQGVKWSPEWQGEILARYTRLSGQAVEAGAQIVVWPETSAPGSPSSQSELRDALAALAREPGVVQVVGAVGIEWEGDAPRYFDSAFVFDPEGALADRYDKAHLVPFGEYVPLRDWLGLVFRAVASGMAPDNVTPGPGARAVSLAPSGQPAFWAGIPICYELLFPDEVRGFVSDGARVLLAITNDAWYGRTGAPYQFLAMTALRSAETGTPAVRAANTGVSAIIDARGRVEQRTRIFTEEVLVAGVALRDPDDLTPYVRFGNVFAWTCWAACLAAAVARRRSRATGESR